MRSNIAILIMIIFIILFIILFVFSLNIQTMEQIKIGAASEKTDELFSRLIKEKEPGAAVLVVFKDQIVFKKGYGVNDLRTFNPINSQTNFRLASLGKQFTAAAIMLLVREGKIKYENCLTEIFPDFPAYGQKITIRHLLHHTSGLPDYEDLMPPYDGQKPVEEIQIKDQDVLALLKQTDSPRFKPGSRWAYSNSGYVLLGLIVEKIAGQPFDEFLRERIFIPLGTESTLAYIRSKNEVSHRAYGHSQRNGHWQETDQSPTSATLGDEGIYSNLEDLAKWDKALKYHTFLNEKEFDFALTPVVVDGPGPVEPDGTPAAYGFGWFLNPWKGQARMWHYGETRGFRTAIQRFLNEQLTVIVLANRSDIEARSFSLQIASFYLD